MKPGDTEVLLRVNQPPQIHLRFADWPPEVYTRIWYRTDKKKYPGSFWVSKGDIVRRGVDPTKAHEFWLPPLFDGRTAYLRNIYATERPQEVDLVQAATIDCRVTAPRRTTRVKVELQHNMIQEAARILPDGRTRLSGLPPGRWQLLATGQLNGVRLQTVVEVHLPAMRTIEIALRLPPGGK